MEKEPIFGFEFQVEIELWHVHMCPGTVSG